MLRRAGLVIAVCAVSTAVGVPSFMAVRHGMTSGGDDSDLHTETIRIGYDENGVHYLLQGADAVHWSDDLEEFDSRSLLEGESGQADRIQSLVNDNQAALAKIREALRAPHFRLPESPLTPGQAVPEIPLETNQLVSLLELRSMLALRRGEWANAFGDAHDILRLAQRIEGANGAVLTTTMMSVDYRRQALGAIREITARSPIDAATARRWTNSLTPYRSDSRAWKRMWAAEYQQRKRLLEWISEQSIQRGAVQMPSPSFLVANARGLQEPLARHPQRTLEVFAEMTRSVQRASEQTCLDLDSLPDPSRHSRVADTIGRGTARERALLIAIAPPNYRHFFLRRCGADSDLAASQTLIALKAHVVATGELPVTLRSLVPTYLESIPADAFDGKPIRYAAEDRRVYSIGSDGIDSGGATPTEADRFAEPSYPIEF